MKCIGLIGGLAWPSTADYYRLLCTRVNTHFAALGYQRPLPAPHLFIESLNIHVTRNLRGRAGDEASWAGYDTVIREAFERLHRAGAEIAAIASNTPHTRLHAIEADLPLPVVSILEATATVAHGLGERALVLGTPVIIRNDAYPRALQQQGVEPLRTVQDTDIDALGHLIDHELFEGRTDSAREHILELCRRTVEAPARDIVCLACTELPLAFPEYRDVASFQAHGFTFVNTIVAHVEAILARAMP